MTPRQIASAAAIAAVITAGAATARLPQDEVPRVAPLAGWSWIDRPMHVPQRFARAEREQVRQIVVEASTSWAFKRDGSTSMRIARAIECAHGITGEPT